MKHFLNELSRTYLVASLVTLMQLRQPKNVVKVTQVFL